MVYFFSVLIIALDVLFIFFVFLCVRKIREQIKLRFESQNWPTIEGIIVESRLLKKKRLFQTVDQAEIVYEYEVNGRRYSASRIAFFPFPNHFSVPLKMSREWIEKYKIGQPVHVYYNLNRPSDAVLETNNTGVIGLLFKMVFISFGLVFLIHVILFIF